MAVSNERIKVLFLTSENAATSIPLELAGILQQYKKIDLKVVTYSGVLKGNYKSQFVNDVVDLNLKSKSVFKAYSIIKKIISQFKPDVIHVHHNLSALITIIAGKLNGVKKIIKTEHNFHRNYKWHQKILNVPIFMFSDLIICNSKSTLESFYAWEKFIASDKSKYIYNGINIQQILSYSGKENAVQIREKYKVFPHEKLFVCASRFTKQKNLDNLIKSFAAASSKNNNIKLILAGDGELKEMLINVKTEFDIDNKIIFAGMLNRDEVFKLMNAADFFVIISLWEGFCNAAVEAMVANCPLICSNIVTLKEVVGKAGVFVDPLSINDIENAILGYADLNNYDYSKLSKENSERATKLYSIDYSAQQYLNYYLA